MVRLLTVVVLILSGLLGVSSLALFTRFLYAGSLKLANLNSNQWGLIGLDAGLSLLFFLQHSGMVRRSCRQWCTRLIPKEFERAVYSIASGMVLLLVIFFWQQGLLLCSVPTGILRFSLRALFWLSLIGYAWGVMSLTSFSPFGIRPLLDRLRGSKPSNTPFSLRGPYRIVRHPLYLFYLLMIWSCPDVTTDRLLFNVLWSSWIVIGAFLEERDLVTEFGDNYKEYRRHVPMLIPGRIAMDRKFSA